MRNFFLKRINIAPVAAAVTLFFALCFAVPCDSFASDDASSLKERYVKFAYSYTECNGKAHPADLWTGLPYSPGYSTTYPEHYITYMMLCDEDHTVYVSGDGVTDNNVTLTSSDTSVLEVDGSGRVTLHKSGKAMIIAKVAADEEYKECTIYLDVTADRHIGYDESVNIHYEGSPESSGSIDTDTSKGPRQLAVALRPGASVKYSSEDPKVAYVDQNGMVTPLSPGETNIWFDFDDGGGKYKAYRYFKIIKVTGDSVLQSPQEITGDLGPFTIDWRDGLQLNLHAETDIEYQVISGASYASVDQSGRVEFSREGKAIIKATAAGTDDYLQAEATILITARDYSEQVTPQTAGDNTTQIAGDNIAQIAEADALRIEIEKALALKKPKLKGKALKGRKNKLTWSKVADADGYIVYVKYPGRKKYVEATSRNANVKSVTHRGLSKKKVYRYKVRAYKRVNGRIYYSPFSKVKKVRAK